MQCNKAIYGQENFDRRLCSEVYNLTPTYEFDWLIPQSELLYFEMNAGKSFMSLYWDHFVKQICKELGLESEKVQMYAKKCSDHYRMWGLLEITYIAFTDELLLHLLRSCKSSNVYPTVNGYRNFCSKLKVLNYVFVQQIVFTYLHALMILREGMRSNKQDYIYAGKDELSLLFFG